MTNDRKRHRILLVDDDRDVVSSLLLTAEGHECRTATSGLGALAELDRFAPDIVILDISLPDISGYEVASKMRARVGRHVYLAAVTGWSGPEDNAQMVAAGFDQRVLKPTDGNKLRNIVQEADHAPRSQSQ